VPQSRLEVTNRGKEVKVKFTLEQVREAQRGSKVIALLFL
jgi:hypothetical protein